MLHEEESDILAIKTLDGEVPVTKMLQIEIRLGGQRYRWKAYLVKNLDPFLVIGNDFLKENLAIINFTDNTLKTFLAEPVQLTSRTCCIMAVATCSAIPKTSPTSNKFETSALDKCSKRDEQEQLDDDFCLARLFNESAYQNSSTPSNPPHLSVKIDMYQPKFGTWTRR